MPFLHSVDDVVLVAVEAKGNDAVGVVNVSNAVIRDGPVCEIESFAELVEGLAGLVD